MKHTSLKKRILSGLTAVLFFAGTIVSPMPVFADGDYRPESPEENGLYPVMSETAENVEISVYTSLEESDVEVCPVEVDADNEGLEVVEGYIFVGKTEAAEDNTSQEEVFESGTSEEKASEGNAPEEKPSEESERETNKEESVSGADDVDYSGAAVQISDAGNETDIYAADVLGDTQTGEISSGETTEEETPSESGQTEEASEERSEKNESEVSSETASEIQFDEGDSEDAKEDNPGGEKADTEGETLYVKADLTDQRRINPRESYAIYSVENNTVKDVLVEDISLEEVLYEMKDDVSGIAIVRDTGYRHKNFEIFPNEGDNTKAVLLDGMVPKNATATASDVTEARIAEEKARIAEEKAQNAEENGTDAGSEANEEADDASGEENDEEDKAGIILAYDITITDGQEEYQPGEERPVEVIIRDRRITTDKKISLWHIKDDGSREKVTGYNLEEGRIRFVATGFSVYEIDEDVMDFDYLTFLKEHGEEGFIVSFIYSKDGSGNNGPCYFTGGIYPNVAKTPGRSGLNITTNSSQTVPSNAIKLYFEHDENANDNQFYIYEMVNGEKKYFRMFNKSEWKNAARSGIDYATEENPRSLFTLEINDRNQFSVSAIVNGVSHYWLRNKKEGDIAVIGYNVKDDTTVWMSLIGMDSANLDGKTYGLMYKTAGTVGYAMTADDEGAIISEKLSAVTIRRQDGGSSVYVPEDSDITKWTFHLSDDKYYLSAVVDGVTKYLKTEGDGVVTTESEAEASMFTAKTDNIGHISLTENGKTLYYDTNSHSYKLSSSEKDTRWLSFVKTVDVDEDDIITYSANKIGVSEVKDQTAVVVYTRIWNEDDKTYEFYAIDHDGTLYPCFERGDNIMWIGDNINTLLWNFTEYTYDDGTPNNYYELQNNYSNKYLAPQIGGQVLSDNTIGLNMPGRKEGEYFSTILAWDDPYYSYAGLKAADDRTGLESCPKVRAQDFYFATMDTLIPTLTEVETVDNTQCGISIKMYDFESRQYMSDIMGTDKFEYTPNLLSTDLKSNGFPDTVENTGSLERMFDEETLKAKGRFREVNHLFIKSTYEATGYFEFDSCQNFATLIQENGTVGENFRVFKELGTSDESSKNTLKHGQFFPYDTIVPGVYSDKNNENIYGPKAAAVDNLNNKQGILPEGDPRKYEKLHSVANGGSPNYFNGMVLDASFVQTSSGKDAWGHDIIFEFTGDDDFWLYVDGELLIDLGGIHSALGGKVNFSTGEVDVNGKKTNLRSVFENNYRKRNPQATEEEVLNHLREYFNDNEIVFKDYTTHQMKIFYMERGGGASNLHMRFNLSYVTPGSVFFTKKVTGTEDLDFELAQYPYQIWYKDKHGEHLLTSTNDHFSVTYQNSTKKVEYAEHYTPPGSDTTYDSVYFLHPDMVAEIHFPEDTIEYKIIECGINNEVYDKVKVNDSEVGGEIITTDATRSSYDSGWMDVKTRPDVTFDNHVDPDGLRTLSFQKKIYDEYDHELSAEEDKTTYDFRLYLSDGVTDDLALANMKQYSVMNPDEYLCFWDAETQSFVPSKYQTFEALEIKEEDSPEVREQKIKDKEKLLFNTSMNGSISKIPAWYTIVVPYIPVGTKFKIEERFNEIPIGYGRLEYERNAETYIIEPGFMDNEGRVRASQSPKLNIKNKRGFGLQANKIWSDKSYTRWHETIYTAVFVGDSSEPMEGTVRVIEHPSTYVRYFIEKLNPGTTLDDYKIVEVKVTNPVVDEDGVVTNYSSLTRVENGELTQIKAIGKGSDTEADYNYSVSYETGEPKECVPGLGYNNTRTDTITNTRTGGLAITLYDMFTRDELAGGNFDLERFDSDLQKYVKVGTYVSGPDGRVTILYDFERDTEYRLTETQSPKGYRGLPYPAVFSIDGSDRITLTGNEDEWQTTRAADPQSGDNLVGYIDLYNKPYTIEVYKYDGEIGDSVALESAYFDLFRGVKGFGGIVKDYTPLYENLKTREDGYIPSIDTGLDPGTYYLTEKIAPSGFIGLDGDVIFEITPLGRMKLKNAQTSGEYTVELSEVEADEGKTLKYYLKIPNARDDSGVDLTVRKIVAGNMGNKSKAFNFTFETEEEDDEKYKFVKTEEDGTVTKGTICHGDTFALCHGDEIVITLKRGTDVSISEESMTDDGYTTSVSVNYGTPEDVNTKTIQEIEEDTVLTFTNTRQGLVPTGVDMPVGTLIILLLAVVGGLSFAVFRLKKLKDQYR